MHTVDRPNVSLVNSARSDTRPSDSWTTWASGPLPTGDEVFYTWTQEFSGFNRMRNEATRAGQQAIANLIKLKLTVQG